MPLPRAHLASLKRLLAIHMQDIRDLQASREQLAAEIERRRAGEWSDPNPKPEGIPGMVAQLELLELEIRLHERLIGFGRDDRLLEALGELFDNPELAAEVAQDPRAFAEARGIELPRDLMIEVERSERSFQIRATLFDPILPTEIAWGPEGFVMPPEDDQDPRRRGVRGA